MARTTIVVPCFNEEKRLDHEAILAFADEHPDVRFLLVDDGSTDGTRALIESMANASRDRITAVVLDRNRGKAEAVRRGVEAALADKPDAFGYWDADLSTPLAEIPVFISLLAQRPGIDVVMGSRVKLLGREIERRPMRHYAGRIFATAASAVLSLPVYDTQCGAKLFRSTPTTRWAFEQPFQSRWLFDVEILARLTLLDRREGAHAMADRIYEHPLTEWKDVAGSKVRLRDFAKAVGELGRIAWRYRWCAGTRQ